MPLRPASASYIIALEDAPKPSQATRASNASEGARSKYFHGKIHSCTSALDCKLVGLILRTPGAVLHEEKREKYKNTATVQWKRCARLCRREQEHITLLPTENTLCTIAPDVESDSPRLFRMRTVEQLKQGRQLKLTRCHQKQQLPYHKHTDNVLACVLDGSPATL